MSLRPVGSTSRFEKPSSTEAVSKPAAAPRAASTANTLAPAVRDGFVTAAASAPVALQAGPRVAAPSEALPAPRVEVLDPASEAVQTAARAAREAMPEHQPQVGPEGSFAVQSAARDELGLVHVRMQRLHNGLPVLGEQAIGHVAQDGTVASVTGLMGRIPAELGRGTPAISAAEAARRIEVAFGLEAGAIPPDAMQRAIGRNLDGTYRDAWQIEGYFANAKGPTYATVDAADGQLRSWSEQHGVVDSRAMERARRAVEAAENGARGAVGGGGAPAAEGVGNDTSLYSGMVEIADTQSGSQREMLDTTRGGGVETNNAQGRTQEEAQPVRFLDRNGAWGEATDPRDQRTGVDAHYGAEMTYDFLRDVLGRDSIDGQGEKLSSTVNVRLVDSRGNLAPNAFWNGTQMTYGMGDGKMFSDLTTLDIAGHEIAHGMTERTAGLMYRNESGGINESLSDIFGVGVEWYASQKNPSVQFDWDIGEDAFTPGVKGDALRHMADPERDEYSIAHYSQMSRYTPDDGVGPPDGNSDNGGVHGSSGIMNNAFYLLAQGGKNPVSGQGVEQGIGIEKALKVYGRAVQFYLTPNSTFAHARESTLRAAADLFGPDSLEVAQVKQAWSAVGVQSDVA